MTVDLEELKKRLRTPVRFGAETQEQAKQRHFKERHEAADAIESLQAENAMHLHLRCVDDETIEKLQKTNESLQSELATLRKLLDHAIMASNAEAKYGDEARQERDRLRKELEEARKDGPRLRIACMEFDGYATDTKDKYDYACAVAQERGHDEPTKEDEIEGLRRMVDNYAARTKTS